MHSHVVVRRGQTWSHTSGRDGGSGSNKKGLEQWVTANEKKKGERRKEKGERRKEKGERRKEKGERPLQNAVNRNVTYRNVTDNRTDCSVPHCCSPAQPY